MSPLRVAAFRRLLAVQTLSTIGGWLHIVTAPWLVLQATGSAAWTTAVTAAGFAPVLLIGPWAGRLADRRDRRQIVAASQVCAAAAAGVLAVLTNAGLVTPASLVALTLVMGAAGATAQPAYLSLVPDYVGREMVPAAVGLESAAMNGAKVVGPLLGGALLTAGIPSVAFGLNAASYLLVAAVVLTTAAPEATRERADAHGAGGALDPRRHLRVMATAAVLGISVQSSAPVLVERELQGSADQFGLLVAVFATGSLVALPLLRTLRSWLPQGREAATALGLLAAAHLAVAAGAALASWPVVLGAVPVAGLAWVWFWTSMQSVLQTRTDPAHRGKALAGFGRAGIGGIAVGSTVCGVAADAVPVAVVLALAGLALVGLAARTRVSDLGAR